MARQKISQRAALRMRKELRQLRERVGGLASAYPGLTVSTIVLTTKQNAEIRTATKLGFLLVIQPSHDDTATVFAVNRESLR